MYSFSLCSKLFSLPLKIRPKRQLGYSWPQRLVFVCRPVTFVLGMPGPYSQAPSIPTIKAAYTPFFFFLSTFFSAIHVYHTLTINQANICSVTQIINQPIYRNRIKKDCKIIIYFCRPVHEQFSSVFLPFFLLHWFVLFLKQSSVVYPNR